MPLYAMDVIIYCKLYSTKYPLHIEIVLKKRLISFMSLSFKVQYLCYTDDGAVQVVCNTCDD